MINSYEFCKPRSDRFPGIVHAMNMRVFSIHRDPMAKDKKPKELFSPY